MNAFARAQAGYDDKHEKAPVEAVIRAVVEVSLISEPPVLVLRTGELTSTLVSVLAASLALSPSAARSPAAIRKVTDTLRRRLLKRSLPPGRTPISATSKPAPSALTMPNAGSAYECPQPQCAR